ncbi:hypothetical protein [Psychrobacillus psychrotolerans]|uniref:hypothetical protein n=1 Tax=Psychrobacillus psychrotolerans TaxID=126156 RepID=UPI003B02AA68
MFEAKAIVSRFVDYFNKEPNSNISKLMKIFSDELIALNTTTKRVGDWRDIDSAKGVALDDTGTNINQPRGVATDEVYRILLKSKIARNLSDGSINTIIQVLATALSVPPTQIRIEEKWNDSLDPEPAAIKLIELPLAKINEAGLDPVNFVRIVQKTVAAGVKVGIIELTGTFEFGTTAMIVDNLKGFGNIEGTIGGYFGAAFSPSTDQELPI